MIAALAATFALQGADALEARLLGTRPVYHQARMAKRLFGTAKPAATMRWLYGAGVGVLQERLRPNPFVFGAAIALFELATLPAIGATPRPRRWPRGEVPLLFAHATVFALLVEAASRWMSAARTARSST